MWSETIERSKKKYIGRKIRFDGKIYTIANVDYNGIIHIKKPSKHNSTTAIGYDIWDVKKFIQN